MLPRDEYVEADKGYRGEPGYIRLPESAVLLSDKAAQNRSRARHETINSRIKTFYCLSTPFRHPLEKHVYYFTAVTALVQLSIMLGECP